MYYVFCFLSQISQKFQIVVGKYRLYFLVIFIFFLANLPSFLLVYGFTDDYVFLLQYNQQDTTELKSVFFAIGRPLTHLWLNAIFSRLNFVSDLRFVRLIGFVGIVIYGAIVFDILQRKKINDIEKIFLIAGLLCIPSINLYISWTQYFVAGFALCFSSLSAFVLFGDEQNPVISFKKALIALVLLLVSGLIHQSPAMQFWPISYLILFYDDSSLDRHKIRKLIVGFTIWFSSMTLVYLFVKLYQLYSSLEVTRTSLVQDYLTKLLWFVSEVIPRSLNFYLFSLPYEVPFYSVPLLLLAVCCIGLILHFQKSNWVSAFLISALFIVLSYFPNLVVSENWASYRTQVALTSMFVIMLFISLKRIFFELRIDPKLIMLVGMFLFFFLYARTQLLYVSYPQAVELSFVKYRLSEIFEKNKVVDNLIVVPSSWEDSLEQSFYDEFGIPSTYPKFAIEPMIRLLVREFDDQPVIRKITIIDSTGTNDFQGEILLDLRDIRFLKLRK